MSRWHLAEFVDAATRQRLGLQADGARTPCPRAPWSRVRLSSSDQQVQLRGYFQQRRGGQEPGGQAISIDGDTDPDGGLGSFRGQISRPAQAQLAHLTIVGQQFLAEPGPATVGCE